MTKPGAREFLTPDGRRTEAGRARSAAQCAWKKELRDTLAIVPDPHDYVYRMTDGMVAALLTARQSKSIMYLPPDIAPMLRPFGLCDYPTNALTAFGYQVWKVLTEESQ
jgi:hypothetical protein